MRRLTLRICGIGAAILVSTPVSRGACCYFSAKDKDVLQPAQKAFITWDPESKTETFTVQPKFEGNAEDFGMVIPTPGRPKLDEMPRDFFKCLAVFTILKQRVYPESKLLPRFYDAKSARADAPMALGVNRRKESSVRVLEAGIVGSLDYKIIVADRSDDLYQWLKDNRYHYAGDEETLGFYIGKGWFFTVMKIDPKQMKPGPDGNYQGEVTPTRFQFTSEQLVYPLRITRKSIRGATEALLYVQAPYKVDLAGDFTYQYQWVPMLQNAQGWYAKGIFGEQTLPGRGSEWLGAIQASVPALMRRGQELGFGFASGTRPQPNAQGRVATTLEWARKLTTEDIAVLTGKIPFGETVPDVDAGFSAEDFKDPKRAEEATKVITERIANDRKERPGGYLVREAPAADVAQLKLLAGHVREGQFVTKIRKVFTEGEMDDDLVFVPAGLDGARDPSEYTEILPTSPP